MLICKGKCDNHKTRNAPVGGRFKESDERRYFYSLKPFSKDNVMKFCGVCAQFRGEKDIRCFCCGAKLRVRSRNNKCRSRGQETIIKFIDAS